MTTPEEGPLWTVRIPGGGIKKVRLPPLPDKISWVVKFKNGMAKRFSYPVNVHGVVAEKNNETA